MKSIGRRVDISPGPLNSLFHWGEAQRMKGPGQEFLSLHGVRKSPLFAETEGGTRFRNIDLDNIDFKAVLRVGGVGECGVGKRN